MEASISPDTEQLRATLTELEQELERAQTRLQDAHEEIVELERRKVEAAGSVSIAQRAIDDLEQRLAGQREALAQLERLEQARQEVAACIAERDAAATEVAKSVESLLARLDELAAARRAVAGARHALRSMAGGDEADTPSPEPAALREQWDRLLERIRADLGGELETDLVEAAARSPMGRAIGDLPAHLRVLATERRRALIRESQKRREERFGS